MFLPSRLQNQYLRRRFIARPLRFPSNMYHQIIKVIFLIVLSSFQGWLTRGGKSQMGPLILTGWKSVMCPSEGKKWSVWKVDVRGKSATSFYKSVPNSVEIKFSYTLMFNLAFPQCTQKEIEETHIYLTAQMKKDSTIVKDESFSTFASFCPLAKGIS